MFPRPAITPLSMPLTRHNQMVDLIHAEDSAGIAAHLKSKVMVEGIIYSSGSGPCGELRFLNLTPRGDHGFFLTLVPVAYSQLLPLEEYEGTSIRVVGYITSSKGCPQMKITHRDQLEFNPAPLPDEEPTLR
jgi:hypothetical protein